VGGSAFGMLAYVRPMVAPRKYLCIKKHRVCGANAATSMGLWKEVSSTRYIYEIGRVGQRHIHTVDIYGSGQP